MLAAALIELDGVLVDVIRARREALTVAFAAEYLPYPAAVEPPDWHAPFDDLVRAVAPAHPAELGTQRGPDDITLALVALRAERDYAARIATGVTLADGAHAAVEALGAELRIGLVTGWRRADAERCLALAGLEPHIRFTAAADDALPSARVADRVTRAVARLRGATTPGRSDAVAALVASHAALAPARAAGARTVLVGGGVGTTPASDPPRADAQIASIRGLTTARLAAALDCPLPHSFLPPPRR